MSYAQGTTHYNFPQIAGTDRPTFADANEAFRTLDTKLYALEGSATDVDGRLDTAEGNIVQLQSDVQTAQGTADLAKSTADTAIEEIGITNTNVSQLTTRVGNKLDSVAIADPYDTTQQYAVDDVVTYNGQRYRCTTAVTVAEPFDVTKWTGEDVETVLDDLKSDLSDINSKVNKGSVSITGVTGETFAQLLNRLHSLIDFDKCDARTKIELGNNSLGCCTFKSSTAISFCATLSSQFDFLTLTASASTFKRRIPSDIGTLSDLSSDSASGYKIVIYY